MYWSKHSSHTVQFSAFTTKSAHIQQTHTHSKKREQNERKQNHVANWTKISKTEHPIQWIAMCVCVCVSICGINIEIRGTKFTLNLALFILWRMASYQMGVIKSVTLMRGDTNYNLQILIISIKIWQLSLFAAQCRCFNADSSLALFLSIARFLCRRLRTSFIPLLLYRSAHICGRISLNVSGRVLILLL